MTTAYHQMSQTEKHNKRLAGLKDERHSFESHWSDITDNLLPRRGRYQSSDKVTTRWSTMNKRIIDSSAKFAHAILTAGLYTGITSPARKWFKRTTPDPELREFGPVKDYLDREEQLLYDIFRASNLYRVLPALYDELGAFGTATCLDLPSFRTVSRYQVFSIGEYWLAQNSEWVVDTCYRRLAMTVKQIVDTYGNREASPSTRWNNFSQTVKNLYQNGDYDTYVTTVHAIGENPEHVFGSTRSREMPFQQFIYELGEHQEAVHKQPLHVGGFMRNPIRGVRWHLLPPDVYGGGPGMDALGDIRQLQEQQRQKGAALAKLINPPMVAPTSLREERKSTLPGDVTYVDTAQGQQGFAPAYTVSPRLAEFTADMMDVRERIRRAFHSDLFLIITERPGIQPLNEAEIFERKEEKLLALGTVMERLDDDLLGPIIRDTAARIETLGLLGPKPAELENTTVEIEYANVIAQAQRSQGLLGVQDTVAFVGNVAQAQVAAGLQPTAWDKIDVDKAIDDFADKRGASAIVLTDDQAEAIRADRREANARQRMAEAAPGLAGAVKDLGDVDTTQRNIVTDLQNAAAGGGPGLQALPGGRTA